MPVTAIVLAAGRSSRFGTNKLLHAVDGQPMILRVLAAVAQCGFQETLVVTGHDAEQVEAMVAKSARIIRNADYTDGMGSSIAAGVRAAKVPATGYLIIPGDMPYLTSATLVALADGNDPERLAACRGAAGPEAPAFFGHSYRTELEKLEGDRGARAILENHPDKVHLISPKEGELVDIDMPN